MGKTGKKADAAAASAAVKADRAATQRLLKRIENELGYDPEDIGLITYDGHSNAVVGVVESFGGKAAVCYDLDKVIANLRRDGMTEEEAMEWYDFNMIGGYLGDATPVFISLFKPRRRKKRC